MGLKIKKHKSMFISPLFVLLGLFFAFYGELKFVIVYFLAVLIHELSHYIIARHLGYRLGRLYIMPYGVCLNYTEDIFYNNDEILIALAGPVTNLFLSIVCVAIWWCFPETYYVLDYFCFCNLVLGLFNLIPCFPLDGGRVLVAILSKKYDRIKIQKYSVILNYVLSFGLLILFVLSFITDINLTYLFVSIFLFAGTINPEKYATYNYLKLSANRKKIVKNGANIKIFAVDENLPVYKIIAKFSKHKFNIIYVVFNNGAVKVLSENNIQNLAIKFPLYLSVKDISNIIGS